MTPAHFPTGSTSRLRGRFVGTYHAQSGVFLSREPLSPATQNEWESSVMTDRGNEEREGKE